MMQRRLRTSLWVMAAVFSLVGCRSEPEVVRSIYSPDGQSRAMVAAEGFGGALGGFRWFIDISPLEYRAIPTSADNCWASYRVVPRYVFWRSNNVLEVVVTSEREHFFDRIELGACPEVEVVTTVAVSTLKDDVSSAIPLEEYLAQSGGVDSVTP